VDSITAFKRTPLPEEGGAATPTPAGARKPATPAAIGPKTMERGAVDLAFVASPAVARKAINQIASTSDQFYIIRTMYVRNDKLKGPTREPGAEAAAPAAGAQKDAARQPSALNFIVGTEKVEIAARIEIVRFTY
jgi:hypothetical protein